MSTESLIPQETDEEKAIQRLVLQGDLGALTKTQQAMYIKLICDQYGLDWKTRPIDIITAQGRTFLYSNRNCFDQLRQKHRVSIKIIDRVATDQVFYVRAYAEMPDGRCDEAIGAVGISGLKGEYLANAMMKAETKAKRRVTQSITAMSLPDETEVETIPEVRAELQAPRRISPGPAPEANGMGSIRDMTLRPVEEPTEAQIVELGKESVVASSQPVGGVPKAKAVARKLPPAVAPVGVKE